MYKEFETKTSYKYLREVILNLKEPICMLGGWAVFFHVNGRFQKSQGRPYLGSRDIDLGFHIAGNLEHSALMQTISILKERLGFRQLSFRLFKEIHTETEEEIKPGQIIPSHFIFPMYIDLIVDAIPEDFNRIFKFNPIDEPLLKLVFGNEELQEQAKEFGKRLVLPKEELLLAMKISSLPDRDKEHKKVKDICDIFALLWYSKINHREAREKLIRFIPEQKIVKCMKNIVKEDIHKASLQIGHSEDEIKRVISLLE